MAKWTKFRRTLMSGQSDANIDFLEMCNYLRHLGFRERVNGDHFIFGLDGIPEILNLQPLKGKVKAFQVKQIRHLFQQYGL